MNLTVKFKSWTGKPEGRGSDGEEKGEGRDRVRCDTPRNEDVVWGRVFRFKVDVGTFVDKDR